MISQAGGSLSWYKSPEIWRIGKYNFYNLPTDGNGLFVYIKDKKTGKVWTPTVIPCDVKPDEWKKATVKSRFRGCKYTITIDNTAGCGYSVKKIFVDGKKFDGEYILSSAPTAEIAVVMGK